MTQRANHNRTWQRHAIAIATSSLVLALSSLNPAYAQSNATGTVYGTVQPGAGVTVVVENVSTGFKRTLTPDATGRFTGTSLPTGTYKATLLRNGQPAGNSGTFDVLIGQGSEVLFSAGTQVVQVTGRPARIDMSSSNNGATFTAKQLDALPIARNLDAIIQLAPNTTRADPRYSGGASFGGGAPSENSYYINGFPVTNPLNQLGSSELPFGAISQAQILTGGFGAEFGRSIGGVVNVTTKSGGNTWEGGFSVTSTPAGLRSKYKDIYYPMTGYAGNAGTDGKLYTRNSDRTRDSSSVGVYIGGPLVKDLLTAFVAVERTSDVISRSALSAPSFTSDFNAGGWADRDNGTDRYFAKFDLSLTKNHLLELSLIGDRYSQQETLSGYRFSDGSRTGPVVQTANFVNQSDHNLGVGASSQILRYTGFLTDDLTVTALFGKSLSRHINDYSGVNVYANQPQISAATASRYPGFTYTNPYPFAAGTLILGPNSRDVVEAARFDVEYKLGSHLLRAGIDDVKLKSFNAGDFTAGGSLITYRRTSNAALKPNNAVTSVSDGGALQSGGFYYYGDERFFTTVTNAQSNQQALYLEDKWQVNKDLTVTPGIRVEKYSNLNGDGETFLKVNTQIHPRLAVTWDALGDKSTKLYATAGRYGVQIPTHLAVRGASRSTFTRTPFVYTGVDANGAPTGRVNLGPAFSTNNEYGQAKDAKTVAALDMKPNSQDELTLGIERSLTPQLNVGARVTYRKLIATIDDVCDPRPFEQYAADNNIDTTNWAGFGCASFNPGQTNSFLIDFAGNGTYSKVTLSADQMKMPKAKRSYFAVDVFAEHPLSNGWYGKVNYTFAKNKGNTEGQTLSDVAQTDVAATQTWDTPELMMGAYGYLPNDRRHQIKAFGYYQVTPEITVGANLLLASGRPKNCIGNFGGTPGTYPDADHTFDDVDYGSAFRWCTVNGVTTATPRGAAGNLPWDKRLDLNIAFRPSAIKGLEFKIDVFNAFNKQTIEAIDEVHEVNFDKDTITPTYGRVISYSAPRAIKFSLTYDMKF